MRLRNRLITLAVACALPALTAACGGGSSGHTVTVRTEAAHLTPGLSNPDAGAAGGQSSATPSVHRRSRSKTPAPAHRTHSSQPSPAIPGSSSSEGTGQGRPASNGAAATRQPERAKRGPAEPEIDMPSTAVNPCTLVTLGEARTITGAAVAASTEAPLGPTCIYRMPHSSANITLAVESLPLRQVTRHLVRRSWLSVSGRSAYCGGQGTQVLWVPVKNGQVLNVTASCSVARRFAALALSRLTA